MSFPKGTRKMVIGGQTWHWFRSGYRIVIWDPENKKVKSSGPYVYYHDLGGFFLPGDVRQYIEEKILNTTVVTQKDPRAKLGKLYRSRTKFLGNTPAFSLAHPEPNKFYFKHRDELLRHMGEQIPMLLIDHWIEPKTKESYYSLLAENLVVTLTFEWPRTWSGSFVEVQQEK